jgi:antitoxin component of MazEF toxin-antitoxin module
LKHSAVLGDRNRLTLPQKVVEQLGIQKGDVVTIEVNGDAATIRPVRKSNAGIARGVYGDSDRYVTRERDDWE